MAKHTDDDSDEWQGGRNGPRGRHAHKRIASSAADDAQALHIHRLIAQALRTRPDDLSAQQSPAVSPVVPEISAAVLTPADAEPVSMATRHPESDILPAPVLAPKPTGRLQSWGLAHLEDPMLRPENAFHPTTLAALHEGDENHLQRQLEGVSGADIQTLVHGDALHDADNIQLPCDTIRQRQFIRQCFQKARVFNFGTHFGARGGPFSHCLNQALGSDAVREAMPQPWFAEAFPALLKDVFLGIAVDTDRYKNGTMRHGFMLENQRGDGPILRRHIADALDTFANECMAELWQSAAPAQGDLRTHHPLSAANAWQEKISQMACKPGSVPIAGR